MGFASPLNNLCWILNNGKWNIERLNQQACHLVHPILIVIDYNNNDLDAMYTDFATMGATGRQAPVYTEHTTMPRSL